MNGAGILLALLLLQFGFTALLLRMASGKWAILSQPITWLYSCWFLGLFLLALPLYRYEESVTMRSGGLMLATLLAFSVGTIIQQFTTSRKQAENFNTEPIKIEKLLQYLLLAGIFGGLLLTINSYLGGGMSIAERLDGTNAALIRELHMSGGASNIGPLFGPASAAYNVGFGALIFYFSIAGIKGWKEAKSNTGQAITAAIFIVVAFIFSIYFAGGRITVVLLCLTTALAYYGGFKIRKRIENKPQKLTNKKSRVFIFGFAAIALSTWGIWYSSTSFLENRTAAAEPETLLFSTHRARFSEAVEAYVIKSKDIGYALFTLSYVSTPIPTYLYYLDLPSTRVVEPQWGQYSFPILARYIMRFTGQFDPSYWDEARSEAFRPLADMNLGANVWATLNRDLLVDFGKVGAMVFMFVLGFLCQLIHNKEQTSRSYTWVPLSVLMKSLLLFSGLTSLLYMNQFAWPLYFCMAILLIAKFKSKKAMQSRDSDATRYTKSSGMQKRSR